MTKKIILILTFIVSLCMSGCIFNKNFGKKDLWFKIAKDSVDFDNRVNTNGYYMRKADYGYYKIVVFCDDGTMGMGQTRNPMTAENTDLQFGAARIVNDTIIFLSTTYGDSPFCWELNYSKFLIIDRDSIAKLSDSYLLGKNYPLTVRTYSPEKMIYHFVADTLPALPIDRYDPRRQKWMWNNEIEYKEWDESIKNTGK